ncbi:MAG: hypothetical protein JNL90_09970 [Planctomycetes bacterium]|nr:hypothetical protein [Planctomycetota bacterium]
MVARLPGRRVRSLARAALLLALFVAGAAAATSPAPRQGAAPAAPRGGALAAAEGCTNCHGGIEEMHPWQPLSCTACHGGDAKATKKEQAHVKPRGPLPNDERLLPLDFDPEWLQFTNPGDLRVAKRVCGSCHTNECDDLFKSLHCTTAGHLSDSLYENGLTKERRTRYSIFPVADKDGRRPPGAYAELPGFPRADDPARRDSLAGHVTDLGRKSCMQCHLWGSGTAVRGRLGQDGNYRGAGCSACHVTYADDGLSRSGDPTIDRFEPGHPERHAMVKAPPTQTCVRCHVGDASIGLHFRGLAQLVPGMPAGPEVPGTTNALQNGVFYVNDRAIVPPDVHHERGMHCVDCHTMRDVMGDGEIWGFMEHAVEIECTDCHGTFDEVSALVTSRGRKLDHLKVEAGLVYLESKVDGKRHFIPQAAHVIDPARPEYNAKAARAMTPQHERLECYTCHAAWNVNFFGFHFDRNESFTQLDLVSGERTAGRCSTQEKVFATYKHFYFGWNDEQKIAPYLVGFSTMGSVHGADGALHLDQELPVTAAGLSGMTMIHHQLHSTRAQARGCVECHRSPATVGLGSPSFQLSREVAALLDLRGVHLIAVDRENLDASTPLASLALPGGVAIAARCDDLQGRFETLFVAIGGAGVAVIDARKAAFPEKVAFLSTDDPRDLLVRGNVLYVADGRAGVRLFDLANPRQPKVLATLPTREAVGLDLAWPHLYVADATAGVKIFDVSVAGKVDLVGHLDPNLDPSRADDVHAVKVLFQWARPDDGTGERTDARVLAAVAGGLQGFFLFDVTEPSRPERLFPPPEVRVETPATSAQPESANRVLDVQVLSRFDLGSPGGDIATEEHDYAYFAVQPLEETMTPGAIAVVRITDPYAPKIVAGAPMPDGAFRLAMAAWYNPPFLRRYALVAGRDAAAVLDTSASDKPMLLGTLFGEGLRVRDLVVEEFPLDRMVEIDGRPLKDLSHEGARFLDAAEILKVLRVPLGVDDVRGFGLLGDER